ncbi:TonB-dependent receptor [Amantichitinum ursilacus]|uniref:Colicin I receptor n=1 Tax=Amantichitinum ursilacus TaxID=857265 RepID=A0A0N0XG35_9NEIS|nr:TonB-dependent receptor [Amantichitinum ursilacus]KPC49683.1 Colicin I receptor precursor [Amantichitinum ursilacus]
MRPHLTPLALAVLIAGIAHADDSTDPANVAPVTVTGSRIPRAQQEGPTPVTVITGAELEKQGYRNVYDALNQQAQNSGFTQGADFGNTFTPAANAISLRGLGPNHTLVLINGRRVADYPTAYDGSVNFVNLANIPSALVERIEILNAGASAIYGSDAIAGVVNIILKTHADGINLNVKAGSTTRGGGDNGRVQISGGKDFGDVSTVFALEVSKTQMLWSKDRDFMSDSTAGGAAPVRIWGRRNLDDGVYLGGANCGAFGGLFNSSTVAVGKGDNAYCGSGQAQPSYWTIQTQNQSENFYGGLQWALNDNTTFFADVMLGFNDTQNNTRGPTWTSLLATDGYFFNKDTGLDEQWTRRFAPEEIGGADVWNRKWRDSAVNLSTGLRGSFGNSGWDYEAVYNISGYLSRNTVPRLLASVDDYFLGPRLGTTDDGIGIYSPNLARFNQPLTSDQFNSLVGHTESRDAAWTQTGSLTTTGKLYDLPAGPLKAAALLELGSQGYSNHPDSQINQGLFYNTSGAQDVSGSRTRKAAALELDIPIVKQLDATLAGRYDQYTFADHSDGKFTWNVGLQYRPVNTLLLRANYATSFRAPDMNYIYEASTKGYYASTTDYYRCYKANQSLSNCDYANYSPGANYVEAGNRNLQSENGKSFGYGFVWSPSRNFDVSVDYWNIKIDNLVTDLDPDKLLRTEAACRTGVDDPTSSLCKDAFARVVRNPDNAVLDPGAINTILVNPINAAQESTSGFDIGGKYKWTWGPVGDFLFSANYSKTLTHHYQQFADDPVDDELHDMTNYDWPDKLNAQVTWSRNAWTSTVQVTRYGKVPNAEGSAYLTPTALANLSVGYDFTKQASLSLIVNNVLNTIKHDDSAGWPFYAVGSYLPYGRQWWLEFNYKL